MLLMFRICMWFFILNMLVLIFVCGKKRVRMRWKNVMRRWILWGWVSRFINMVKVMRVMSFWLVVVLVMLLL